MADAGTISQYVDNMGWRHTFVETVLTASTTPLFSLRTDDNSSFQVTGTFAGATVTPQGSSDGVTWLDIGIGLTAAGGGTLTPGDVFWPYYRFNVTGGDGTTDLDITVTSMIPR